MRSRFVRSRLFSLRAMVGLPIVFSTLTCAHLRPGGRSLGPQTATANTNETAHNDESGSDLQCIAIYQPNYTTANS